MYSLVNFLNNTDLPKFILFPSMFLTVFPCIYLPAFTCCIYFYKLLVHSA